MAQPKYIRDLNPPRKLYCALVRMGIYTLDDFAKKTKKQFSESCGVGKLTMMQAEQFLKENHRRFKVIKKRKAVFTGEIKKPVFKWR